MKLLIEVSSREEFEDLIVDLEWKLRNWKLNDGTIDKYQAAASASVEMERERCAKICADRAARLAATAEQYPTGTAACFEAEARECERRIRNNG